MLIPCGWRTLEIRLRWPRYKDFDDYEGGYDAEGVYAHPWRWRWPLLVRWLVPLDVEVFEVNQSYRAPPGAGSEPMIVLPPAPMTVYRGPPKPTLITSYEEFLELYGTPSPEVAHGQGYPNSLTAVTPEIADDKNRPERSGPGGPAPTVSQRTHMGR